MTTLRQAQGTESSSLGLLTWVLLAWQVAEPTVCRTLGKGKDSWGRGGVRVRKKQSFQSSGSR